MNDLVLLILNILIVLSVLLWFYVPVLYGLPYRPARTERIRKALNLANLQPDEILYDLGAGDGRVLLIAAREFKARAIGIEIGPLQCAVAWLRGAAGGLGSRVQIRWGNFLKTDLRDADVVYVYATSKEVIKLASTLKEQMKPGSRVVSISADFPEWEPSVFDDHDLVFVYEMPPREGSLTTYMLKNAKE
jgi:SAM-dependent methyltransferase